MSRKIKDIRDWKYLPRREKIFMLVVLGVLAVSLLFAIWNGVEFGEGETKTSWMLELLGVDDPASLKIILGLCLLWIGIGTVLVALKKVSQRRLITLSLVALVVILSIAFIVKLLK